jgi:NADH dehydrogenase
MQKKGNLRKNKRVVILGGGFGGVNLYKNLHALMHNEGDNLEFIIISDNNYFLFTPLLHEVATGSLSPGDITSALRENFSCCIREIILEKVISIDAYKKKIVLKNESISFDYLVIATGASVNFWGIEGAERYAIPLKDIKDAIKLKNQIISTFELANELKKKTIKIVLVGGGATGIELAVEIFEFGQEMKPFYENLKVEDTRIIVEVLNSSEEIVPGFSQKVRNKIMTTLSKEGSDIFIKTDSNVKKVNEKEVILSDGKKVNYDVLVWSAGVKPNTPEINIDSVKNTEKIKVNKFFNIEPFKNIFSIGDVSEFTDYNGKSLPQLAQVATEESKICAENIYRLYKNKDFIPFEYKEKGLLLSLGRNNAIVSINTIVLTGKTAWILWKFIYLALMYGRGSRIRLVLKWILNSISKRDISRI